MRAQLLCVCVYSLVYACIFVWCERRMGGLSLFLKVVFGVVAGGFASAGVVARGPHPGVGSRGSLSPITLCISCGQQVHK